jgi:hypothetical protein
MFVVHLEPCHEGGNLIRDGAELEDVAWVREGGSQAVVAP